MHLSSMKLLRFCLVLILSFVTISPAQERRVRPAFPIAPGEKMLVIPGVVFDKDDANAVNPYVSEPDMDVYYYHIPLPVGTKLKRIVVDAADNDGNSVTKYMVIRLVRKQNGVSGSLEIRRATTKGYNSTAFGQFVSNPTNHTMLQGWTYYVDYSVFGGTSAQHQLSTIKIIYE